MGKEQTAAPTGTKNVRKTPIESPAPDCVPPPRPELTDEEKVKYASLLEKMQAVTEVKCTTVKDSEGKDVDRSGPITPDERMWLTRECLLRYLRATRWVVDEAASRLSSTLAWRREYGITSFTPDYISPEQETGKQIIVGFDRVGRPCQYLNPNRQNTDATPRQIHHLFYMVELVADMMPAGVETLNLMINFKPTKTNKNTSTPISTAREVLHILQNHYPERLGKALIINVPWVVWGFFKIITPFIDPVTREKLKFNEDMRQYVPPQQLWSADWGGEMDFEYDHEVYWPAINKLCRERRAEKKRRWEAAGSEVGELEDYLVAGTDESVKGVKYGGAAVLEREKEEDAVDAVGDKLAEAKLETNEVQA
ncbi:CRAL TRIO N [Geosmithia morbida]|uniref:CRAL TRIO N n=1 Tax=Geosmithia morbida TaxID=1094350 RepID=A0A9P4YPE0_9HYPO|nr:CRAL TRIO N [Geosmithia morbida]KAF4120681.1 CRAL TRIO N [Geosmithia morbida]